MNLFLQIHKSTFEKKMAEEAPDFIVVKNNRGKSDIWQHFGLKKKISDGKVETQIAICFHCQSSVKLAGGTSNIAFHMRRHHPSQLTTPIKFKTVTNCENANPQPSTASSATATNATSWDSLTAQKKTMQTTIYQVFKQDKKYAHDSEQSRSKTHAVAHFLVKDMRPYSMVDGDAFKDMVTALDPHYVVPSRNQFSHCLMSSFKKSMIRKIEKNGFKFNIY